MRPAVPACLVALAALGLSPAAYPTDSAPPTEEVRRLVADLKSDDVTTRRVAARKLSELGAAAKSAVPDLVAALKDQDLGVRTNAVNALAATGGEAKELVPALLESLAREGEFVR